MQVKNGENLPSPADDWSERLLDLGTVEALAEEIGCKPSVLRRQLAKKEATSGVLNSVKMRLGSEGAVLSYRTLCELAENAPPTVRLGAAKALLAAAGLAEGGDKGGADNPLAGYTDQELRVMQDALKAHRAINAVPVSAPEPPIIDAKAAEMLG